jgi:hypothetical protein
MQIANIYQSSAEEEGADAAAYISYAPFSLPNLCTL